jgi:hypothetical protein
MEKQIIEGPAILIRLNPYEDNDEAVARFLGHLGAVLPEAESAEVIPEELCVKIYDLFGHFRRKEVGGQHAS